MKQRKPGPAPAEAVRNQAGVAKWSTGVASSAKEGLGARWGNACAKGSAAAVSIRRGEKVGGGTKAKLEHKKGGRAGAGRGGKRTTGSGAGGWWPRKARNTQSKRRPKKRKSEK